MPVERVFKRPPRRLKVEEVEAALRASAGIQTIAATKLGIGKSALCKFIQRNPKLARVIDEIISETVDLAHSKLIVAIGKGDFAAIKYYLDNKGQAQGFGIRKLAFQDGDGQMVVPGVLVMPVRELSAEAWEARNAEKP